MHIVSEHAERYGYGVVERFVGHGVGTVFHSEPIILHNRKFINSILTFCTPHYFLWLGDSLNVSEKKLPLTIFYTIIQLDNYQ